MHFCSSPTPAMLPKLQFQALKYWIAILLSIICTSAAESRLIQTLQDTIGAENFTYYRLQRTGVLQIDVISLFGDVDIYVSSEVQHPDYSNYDLKSETCGVDTIVIPSTMARPVYISLFGHPNNFQSKYRVSIFEVEEPTVDDYEVLVDKYERYYYEEMDGGSIRKDPSPDQPSRPRRDGTDSDQVVEEELPLWWKILLGVLEFGIEVIL